MAEPPGRYPQPDSRRSCVQRVCGSTAPSVNYSLLLLVLWAFSSVSLRIRSFLRSLRCELLEASSAVRF
jgi:hypothetical protein